MATIVGNLGDSGNLSHLAFIIYSTLKTKDVATAVNIIKTYNLDVQDYKDLFVATKNEPLFKEIDRKVKSAVTRALK